MPPEFRKRRLHSNPKTVLRVSEHFLRLRDFDACKKYALQLQQSHPNLPGLPQLLAVVNVLLATSATRISGTHPNYYTILNLKPFSQNPNLLNENFTTLLSLLSPKRNRYPFADEAFELVRKAWNVLSDVSKKAQFDRLLRNNGYGNGNFGNADTFWTVCPYCCYVYEYAKVYEDCCLRCSNEKCGKGFHGLAINSPPNDVLVAGTYPCSEIFRVGDNAGGSSWMPFMLKKQDQDGGGVNSGDNVCGGDNFVEISDDSEENSTCDGDVKSEESSKEVETGEVNVEASVSKPVMRRKKKSVGKNSKKVMGKGFRVGKQNVVGQTGEELDSSTEGSNGEEDMEMPAASGGEFAMAEMEFFDGDDDIFVSLDGI